MLTYDMPKLPSLSQIATGDSRQISSSKHPNVDLWEDFLIRLTSIHFWPNILQKMLSETDKEISDLLHYLEFNALSAEEALRISRQLQSKRRTRRDIKNDLEIMLLIQDALGAETISKLNQSLSHTQSMKNRKYTPRKLKGLFESE